MTSVSLSGGDMLNHVHACPRSNYEPLYVRSQNRRDLSNSFQSFYFGDWRFFHNLFMFLSSDIHESRGLQKKNYFWQKHSLNITTQKKVTNLGQYVSIDFMRVSKSIYSNENGRMTIFIKKMCEINSWWNDFFFYKIQMIL